MTPLTDHLTAHIFEQNQEQLWAALEIIDKRVQWAVLRARAQGLDPQDNFRGLYFSDGHIDDLLHMQLGQHQWSGVNGHGTAKSLQTDSWPQRIEHEWLVWQRRSAISPADVIDLRLTNLVNAFELTNVELEAFLLIIAPEIDPRYGQIYAYLQDDVTCKRPSVDLVLNLLTADFHEKIKLRSLFRPQGRLMQNRLLQPLVTDEMLLANTVRPYPHIIEYLLGSEQLDHDLRYSGQLTQIIMKPAPKRMSVTVWQQLHDLQANATTSPPLFLFHGPQGTGRQEAAHLLAFMNGQPLLTVDLALLAVQAGDIFAKIESVLRDGRLYNSTVCLTGWEIIATDESQAERIFTRLLDFSHTLMIVAEKVWRPRQHFQRRPVHSLQFKPPDYNGRLCIWQSHLQEYPDLNPSHLAAHFRFTAAQIEDVIAAACNQAEGRGTTVSTDNLLAAARLYSNQKLAQTARKIEPRYTWGDIVLPADTLAQLNEMVSMLQYRPYVLNAWGFGRKLAYGRGVCALFAGESGTGKTMAADIMAGALGLDLYKIDLSALVSKYIGETEKNLEHIFTEAATSNAILFFDEADAVFGKRSEVKDSHDRYANMGISYLLQRIEDYDGVVILATNLRANLDDAFTRRLSFIISFPFPDVADRARIWAVNCPAELPLAEDVDFVDLAARFPLSGGHIRNVIRAAAFLAAAQDSKVAMPHLLHAMRREYQKMGRLIDPTLFNLQDQVTDDR